MRWNIHCFLLALYVTFSPGMLSAQELIKGMYVSSFERSDFRPCGVDEHWWLSGDAYSEIEKFILKHKLRKTEDDWYPNSPVYIEVHGTMSESGKWGHLGTYQRELSATKLVVIKADGDCAGK